MLTFFNELPSDELVRLFADDHVASFLANGGHALAMGMMDLTAERAAIVRDLERRGVPVTAWLLLDLEQGYWFNADNSDDAIQRYRDTVAWAEAEGLRLHRIGLDIESPRTEVADLWNRPAATLWSLFRNRREKIDVRDAERRYAELVDEIRASGRSVETYQVPLLVDERRTGSMLLRRCLGILDVQADVEVLMLYDTYLGESLVRSYFPEADGIALGVTGGGVNAADRREREHLLAGDRLDAQLLAARHFRTDAWVFSLEGCVWNGLLPRFATIDLDGTPGPPDASTWGGRAFRAALRLGLRLEPVFDLVLPSRRPA